MKKSRGGPQPPRAAQKCPICGKPTDPAYRPFCSKRCRQVDLNRWLSGAYVIPGREDASQRSGGEDDEPS